MRKFAADVVRTMLGVLAILAYGGLAIGFTWVMSGVVFLATGNSVAAAIAFAMAFALATSIGLVILERV